MVVSFSIKFTEANSEPVPGVHNHNNIHMAAPKLSVMVTRLDAVTALF